MEELKQIEVYRQNASYARQHGEMAVYQRSNVANVACRNAIEEAIRQNFDGMRLDVRGAKKVLETFGAPRVLLVLANTVQQKAWDGRFSVENRKWAQTYELPVDEELAGDRRSAYVVQSHPAVLDGFIQQTRQLVQERTLQQKKERLQDKLHPAKLPAQPKKSRAAAQER